MGWNMTRKTFDELCYESKNNKIFLYKTIAKDIPLDGYYRYFTSFGTIIDRQDYKSGLEMCLKGAPTEINSFVSSSKW